jgi:hypothetical protein
VTLAAAGNEVDEMSMEGQVHLVEQPLAAAAGGPPAEPGIDIRGDQMQLTRATRPDAKAIVSGRPAIVKGRGLDLQGPMVEFDRGQNRLTVDGAGKLSLPMAGGAGAPESLAFLKGLPATRTIDVEGGETGDYTLTLVAGGTPGGGDMGDMGGEDLGFTAIDQLMAMEGADDHILNVVCSAVDTLDLISTMETMTEDQLMARIEAGERFTNAAYASGLALGFARDEVENQVAEFGAAMLLDPEMAVDVPSARQECMGLVG